MSGPACDYRRILLIRRKALGDALVSLPAVAAVADAWPTARIDLVVDRPLADLFGDLAANVNVVAYPAADRGSWLTWLRHQRYELVIDWLGSPRTAIWTALSGARLRVGYDLPRRRWAYNLRVPRNRAGDQALRGFAGEAFLDPVRALGLDPGPWSPGGGGAPGSGESPDTAAAAPVGPAFAAWLAGWCVQPATARAVLVFSATWSAKAWPARHVAGLWKELTRAGLAAVIAPGPGDDRLMSELAVQLPASAFAPPTSLREMAALLRRVDVFVGTDSGLRHLAALLGLPTVTVFGPTDPAGWNPPGPRHVSVRTGEPCSPCDLKVCPVPGRPCLEDLPPGPVVDATLALLRRPGSVRVADSGSEPGPGKVPVC